MTIDYPSTSQSALDVAIIGMACRFPGANSIEAFWQNLRQGVESITHFSDDELIAAGEDVAVLRDPRYVRTRGILKDVEYFDAAFFDYSSKEAQISDPQHRIFLECAWEALEHAGYGSERYRGVVGVYGSSGISAYLINNLLGDDELVASVGHLQLVLSNDKDFLTTRVSYKLNLEGPSVTVQTACSSSLVGVHLAYQALLSGECDMALAGGVAIEVPQQRGYLYQEHSIVSPDGHCRAFDARAQGTVFSNGAGVVVLKRLDDAVGDGDAIYAVIKGSAINNDGARKVGYTAPRVAGQANVIRAACRMAEVEPATISYIETHGTGTALGDPVELAALTQVFRESTERQGYCAIGSLKTNIGHLDTAAGIAGLIKTALALQHGYIPASLHFEQPNPAIDFADSPFYVNTRHAEWKTEGFPRRAGVSSFGMGGTNAHVVLEEAPAQDPSGSSRPWQALVLSAKTGTALDTAQRDLAQHLRCHPDLALADVAYTLQVGRQPFGYRRIVLGQTIADVVSALEGQRPERVFSHFQPETERPVVFLFPGQGAQYVDMGRELYQVEPVFREWVDRCAELLVPHLGLDLRDVLYPNGWRMEDGGWRMEDRSSILHPPSSLLDLDQTQYTQPALFVVEYALARLWMAWGVRPQAMIGHSIGEYVAACLAGVCSLEDALALVALRGRMMQALPAGTMLGVMCSAELVQPFLDEWLSLAAINGPALCVVAGPADAVDDLQVRLANQGIDQRRLHTSHAFHSAMMDPIMAPFAEQVRQVALAPPQIPFLSNVTGTWISADEATDSSYWAEHLRRTVRFADGLRELLQESDYVLLEVGPGTSLSTLARQQALPVEAHRLVAAMRHPQDEHPDSAVLIGAIAKLWLAGGAVDWQGLYTHERRHRIPLPTYPFERRRYWIESHRPGSAGRLPAAVEASPQEVATAAPQDGPYLRPPAPPALDDPVEQLIAALWQELLGVEPISADADFFALGGHSLIATQMISRLQESFPITLSPRDIFEAPSVARLAQLVKGQLLAKLIELSEDEAQLLV